MTNQKITHPHSGFTPLIRPGKRVFAGFSRVSGVFHL